MTDYQLVELVKAIEALQRELAGIRKVLENRKNDGK